MDSTSDLYTGTNSGSFGNARTEQRLNVVNDKREKRSQLIPAYELVVEFIDKEIAKTSSLESLLVETYVPEDQLKEELIARRRYLEYLNGLKANLGNLLRGQR